ncbi:hypothetical protein SAMN05444008_102367 [Cnuella takakiae]|uniref:Uncharacterized protein n=1 Tax=Cnuella takakiae TaxID=1302690 RepID=A0A1M4VSX9_9BACT|nr:hypothetical protein [Cnuella takakiae]OLY92511.1 hypothetical protein BUE76_11885 [Cnuella takakiae]SHE71950.1 hypothetical protein SAMN05444008_102367 [Cnuella takakiae]
MSEVKCPKCGSNQISANKKGFSAGKAVAGAVLAGPVGLAAGAIGKNKVDITCLACGNTWNPVQLAKDQELRQMGVEREWRKSFIAAFEAKDLEKAHAIYEKKYGEPREGWSLEIEYAAQKKTEDRLEAFTNGVYVCFGLIVLAIIFYLIYY